jgi:hypothetical protein
MKKSESISIIWNSSQKRLCECQTYHATYCEPETARLTIFSHPVAGAPFYRVVPKGGAVMNGYYLPGGTNIGELWISLLY